MAATLKPKELSRGVVGPTSGQKISVTLEMAAIVLPLGCQGACFGVAGLRPSLSLGKIIRAMNLAVVLLFLTSLDVLRNAKEMDSQLIREVPDFNP